MPSAYVSIGHTFILHECPSCGCWFGIENHFETARRSDKKSFYCPNGHTMSFTRTPLEIEKEERAKKEREMQATINSVHFKLIAKEKEACKLRKEIRQIKKQNEINP